MSLKHELASEPLHISVKWLGLIDLPMSVLAPQAARLGAKEVTARLSEAIYINLGLLALKKCITCTLNPKPYTLNYMSACTLHPKPETLHPKLQTLNPKP